MKRISILLIYFLSVSATGWSQTGGLSFLKIGVSARAAGMAEAYTAVVEDASAVFWNPAGVVNLENRQLLLNHTEWFQDIRSEFVAFVTPIKSYRVGLSFNTAAITDFELRTDVPSLEPLSIFDAHDLAFGVSVAKFCKNRVAVGFTIKYIYEKIYIEESSGAAIDVGIQYRLTGFPVRIGLAVQNLGAMTALNESAPKLPKLARLGVALFPLPEYLRQRWLVACDVVSVFDSDWHLLVGSEYRVTPGLSLRAGYQTGYASKDLHFGIGLFFHKMKLDYAFVPLKQDLGTGHRFSFLFNF